MRALDALAGMLSRSIENPAEPITPTQVLSSLDSADQLWGPAATSPDPMRIGTALRCVQILASSVAGVPLRTRNVETRADVEIPALSMRRPGTTPFETWETVVASLALRGNGYVRKVRNRAGQLSHLVPIMPQRVKVKLGSDADAAAVGMPYVKRFVIDGDERNALTEFDVMHIPGLSFDGLTGVSVLTHMRRTFEIAANADDLAARTYGQGLLLSGFLSTDQQLTAEQAAILKARWRARMSGKDNAFDVGILDNGASFQQVSMSPADAQFLEARRFQTSEIARIFGLPGWMINDQEKSTSWGTGMEQQFTTFVVLTLKPYMQRIEQRVTREILDPRTEKAEFKVEGLLRGDSKSRAAFYSSGITNGWLVPNDVRKLEDMEPVAWGDEPYRPYNESAGSQENGTGSDDDADDDADA